MQFAEVLVDVPTMQTNRPFTYQIPDKFENQIQVGVRVIVPFGRSSRKIQGIVLRLMDHVEYSGKIKPILSLMDLRPVINSELMKLSKWLSEVTYSFRISCIWTMLPALMKSKTEKLIVPTASDSETKTFFAGHNYLSFSDEQNNPHQFKKLKKLINDNKVEIDYSINNHAKNIVRQFVQANCSPKQLVNFRETLPANATIQAKILEWLIANPDVTIPESTLIKRGIATNAALKASEKKGWIKFKKIKVRRNPYEKPATKNYPLKLNHDQQKAVDAIDYSIIKEKPTVFLLEGVTGSGKTEVYLQAIQKALIQKKTALMLVPEISLTPQIVQRVRGRFGDNVAVLHSGLSKGERYDEWQRINTGEAKVVVGARSAVFAPLTNLGVIIMDEEHDDSYKQEDVPRYSTREVAKKRAQFNNCPVVLGSATPSLESRARAGKGVYKLLMMPKRINHQALPEVKIVDMRKEIAQNTETSFSKNLLSAIKERITRQEQVVLMLNRRGFSSFIMCRNCGFVLKCPNCDISLTLHLSTHTMKCHYCGHREAIPNECPVCHSREIRSFGTGTEKVEKELQQLIPSARIIRMDVDTTRRKGAHEKLLSQFGQHQADILLGTQMIAKGLDFPNITLVGVLNADTSLELPDFRSSERTFQLLTQVSGRAGRAEKKGEVYIQTFNPDNYAIRLAQKQDYEHFYYREMQLRHEANYPPYFFTVRITSSAKNERQAERVIYEIKDKLQKNLSNSTIILGPSPSAIAKLKGKYYYQIIIKYKHEPMLAENLDYLLVHYQRDSRKKIYISIDPDPVSFM